MRNRLTSVCLMTVWLAALPAAGQLSLGAKPLRIVLLVDSSSEVSAMINPFRAGLKAFLDGVPEGSEVALISTGGQIRVRTQPTSDMEKLQKAVGGFAQDGGANAFLFMKDFLQRRGHAYGIVVHTGGGGMSATSDFVENLASNTSGTYEPVNSATAVPDKMKAIAARLASLP